MCLTVIKLIRPDSMESWTFMDLFYITPCSQLGGYNRTISALNMFLFCLFPVSFSVMESTRSVVTLTPAD